MTAKPGRFRAFLLDAKKALGAAGVMATAALGFGLIDSRTAGLVTAGIGVVVAGVVYLLDGPK